STAGAANLVGGASCGNGGSRAPDATFLYTAPFAGSYVIDTFGSTFDTLLYVRANTCSGTQLACNDDANGTLQSKVALMLAANQQVVIVVDGFNSAGGNFTLHVNGSAAQSAPRSLALMRILADAPTVTPTVTSTRTPTATPLS